MLGWAAHTCLATLPPALTLGGSPERLAGDLPVRGLGELP